MLGGQPEGVGDRGETLCPQHSLQGLAGQARGQTLLALLFLASELFWLPLVGWPLPQDCSAFGLPTKLLLETNPITSHNNAFLASTVRPEGSHKSRVEILV